MATKRPTAKTVATLKHEEVTRKSIAEPKAAVAKTAPAQSAESSFAEVVELIQQSRQRAYQAVNSELIDLYWRVGEYVSRKLQSAEWGDGVVAELARYIARRQPGVRGGFPAKPLQDAAVF